MTLISFLGLAGKGERGGALLIVTRVDFGMSFVGRPLVGGIRGVNLDEIFPLSMLDFWSVNNASYLEA